MAAWAGAIPRTPVAGEVTPFRLYPRSQHVSGGRRSDRAKHGRTRGACPSPAAERKTPFRAMAYVNTGWA